MFPSSTFSLLEDVSSAAVFELQHSVPLHFVQEVTEEMLDLLQEHRLLAQVSFTFTLHWQRLTFSKNPGASSTCFWTGCKSWPLRFHFNFSGSRLCRSRVTHWQIYRWTRNAWKEAARLVGEVILALRRDSTVTSDSTCWSGALPTSLFFCLHT